MNYDFATVFERGWNTVLAEAQKNSEFHEVDRKTLSCIIKRNAIERYPISTDWAGVKRDLKKNYGDNVAEKLLYSMIQSQICCKNTTKNQQIPVDKLLLLRYNS